MTRSVWVLVLLSTACPRAPGPSADDDDAVTNDDDAVTDDDDATSAAPSAPGVTIEPAAPEAGESLLCFVAEDAVDPLGRTMDYRFAWTRDDVPLPDLERVVPMDTTLGGETWRCTVTAVADGVEGPPGEASVTVVAANRPPNVPSVALQPPSPRANQSIRCGVEAPSDPDGDSVTLSYTWQVGGVDAGVTGPDLAASATTEGETWSCAVVAFDGELSSDAGTASAVIRAPAWTPDITGSAVSFFESSCFACPGETWYIGAKAFDDDTGTGTDSWHATWTGGPEWVGLDFGEGNDKIVTRYGLMGAAFHPGYRAVDWQLQGSADGQSWTTLHSVTGANLTYVMWGGEPFTHYDVDNEVGYAQYRVHVTANAGGQQFADEVGIVEIEMFENAP